MSGLTYESIKALSKADLSAEDGKTMVMMAQKLVEQRKLTILNLARKKVLNCKKYHRKLLVMQKGERNYMKMLKMRAGYRKFNINYFNERDCRRIFRFGRNDFKKLVHYFGLDDLSGEDKKLLKCKQYAMSSNELLAILLARLASDSDAIYLEHMFLRTTNVLSTVYNKALEFIYEKFKHRIHFDEMRCKNSSYVDMCIKKIRDKAGEKKEVVPENVCCFIDGTDVHTRMPKKEIQDEFYNGRKSCHGIKSQGVIAPDGMFISISKVDAIKVHDMAHYDFSGLDDIVKEFLKTSDNKVGKLFGDKGYHGSNNKDSAIVCSYKLCVFDDDIEEKKDYNNVMKRLRICAEWGFGLLNKFFPYSTCGKRKIVSERVGKAFYVSCFLCNVHNSLYRNQTSKYYKFPPPTLEEFLGIN